MRDNKFDPATELVIAGIDTDEGPENPCFNAESNAMPDSHPLIQRIAKYMLHHTVFSAVTTTTIGGKRYVDAGRKRVRAARIANVERAELGLEPIRMPTVHQQFLGNDRDLELLRLTAAENYLRADRQSPMAPVRDATRLFNKGDSIEEIADTLNVTASGVRRWIKISELAPKVQDAIEAGAISADAALLLHGKPEPEQVAQLENILLSPAGVVEQIVAKRRSAKATKDNKPKRVKKKDMQKALGKAVKRSARAVSKIMNRQNFVASEEFTRGALWAIGDLSDEEAGVFKKG